MALNEAYQTTESDTLPKGFNKHFQVLDSVWVANQSAPSDKVYTYDEAISLTGNGRYNFMICALGSFIYLVKSLDLFCFSVIVPAFACEIQLDHSQKNILMTVPFLGTVIAAYPWGYIADTQGRRKSLLWAMAGSSISMVVSAFSSNWILLGVSKFIGSSFCMAAQSTPFAFVGESCPPSYRNRYMLMIVSGGMMFMSVNYVPAYLILHLDFSYDLGFINFTPWRLLTLFFALLLGLSTVGLFFFYESPKFLLNAGYEAQALEVLEAIYRINKNEGRFPVKRVILQETGGYRKKGITFSQSLLQQVRPLFRLPLLWRTVQMFFLFGILAFCSNSLYMWFPTIAAVFTSGIMSEDGQAVHGICDAIITSQKTNVTIPCKDTLVNASVMWSGVAHAVIFSTVNIVTAKFSSRKKIVTMLLVAGSSASAVGAAFITDPLNISSFILYYGTLVNSLTCGIVLTYIVDIYPTSFSGMASCLTGMFGRLTGVIGSSIIGFFVFTHCEITFCTIGALLFSVVIIACFLPPDRANNK